MMETEPLHYDLSASSAERWLNCKRAPYMIKAAPPEIPNIHAAKGTVAHKVAATLVMEAFDRAGELTDKWNHSVNQSQDGFEILVDDPMLDGVSVYVDHVRAIVEGYLLKPHQWGVETSGMIVPGIMTPIGPVGGTPDHWAIVPGVALIISDYKNGYNEVDVNDNPQLLTYALAKFCALTAEEQANIPQVTLFVVQPNGTGPAIKSISYTIPELSAFYQKLVAGAAAVTPDAELKAGTWCKYCPAQLQCPAWDAYWKTQAAVDFAELPLEVRAQAAAMQERLKSGAPSAPGVTAGAALIVAAPPANVSAAAALYAPFPDVGTLSYSSLSGVFQLKSVMNKYFDAAEDRLKLLVEMNPEQYPEWQVAQGLSNRKFIDEEKAEQELSFLGDAIYKPSVLKSPKGIEDEIKRLPKKTKEDKEIRLGLQNTVNILTTRTPTGKTLKRNLTGAMSGAAADFQGLVAPSVVDATSVKEVK